MKKSPFFLCCTGISEPKNIEKPNEDSFWFDEQKGIIIIADGLGAQNAGEIASNFAVNKAKKHLTSLWHDLMDNTAPRSSLSSAFIKERLHECLLAVNDFLLKKSSEDPLYKRMGSTIVIGILWQNYMYFINAGDSRAYLVNAEGIQQITEDHSFIASLLRQEKISLEEARRHPDRNILLSHLGVSASELIVSLKTTVVNPYDQFVFCTDGITDVLDNSEIHHEFTKSGDMSTRCKNIIDLVKQKGKVDDTTLVLAQIKEEMEGKTKSKATERLD